MMGLFRDCFRYEGIFIIAFLLLCNNIHGQQMITVGCKEGKISQFQRASSKTTIADAEEDNYDVKHVHIDVVISNESVAISGSVTTSSVILVPDFKTYVFELDTQFDIDSIIINGTNESFLREKDVVKAALSSALPSGANLRTRVYYHGTPKAGSVFFFQEGLNNSSNEVNGSPVTYTLSEPYSAKKWWPCKQSLQDKVDSADIWITVPDSLKAGSNGILQYVRTLPDNKSRYEWKTNYSTAYYLFSLAVSNYSEYTFDVTLADGTKFPVQNYIYNDPSVILDSKIKIDSTALMLQYFSQIFGRYPFYKEKYGHCMTPVFGGMEHQTMTTLRHFDTRLVAHELAHQWFGDHVTCATWQDIWLNEGFASYSEYLFKQKFQGYKAAYEHMLRVHNLILNDTNKDGSVYVPQKDTVDPYRIFNGRLSYNKASAVLHMLRYVIGDDDIFFSILKRYNELYAFDNATTEDFKQLAENISSVKLDTFFNQWIYGEGYPVYKVTWNQLKNDLYLKIEQTTVMPASVSFYNIPIEVAFKTQIGIELRKLDIVTPVQEYIFPVNGDVTNIFFDPDNWVLNGEEVIRDYSYGLKPVPSGDILVHPNPTKDTWIVRGLSSDMKLYLVDISGKVVWRKDPVSVTGVAIETGGFARGVYILKVLRGEEEVKTIKLVKI